MSRHSILLATLLLAVAAPAPLQSQGMLDRMKKRAEESAKRKVEDRVDQKTGKATDKVLDGAENAVKCAASDKACADKAKKEGKKVEIADESEGAGAAAAGAKESGSEDLSLLKAGEGAWANYDFVPGEKPIIIDDFAKDVVGDFPKKLDMSDGNMEIVDIRGKRWLRMNGGHNTFNLKSGGALPTRFTLEFDMFGEQGECWIYPAGDRKGAHFRFGAYNDGGVVRADGRDAGVRSSSQNHGKPYTARIMVDGRYAKAYVNEKRVVNVPNLEIERGEAIQFYCDGNDTYPLYVGNFKFAAGGKKLYDALAETGRVATQGIFFDTGSDVIRGESTPTLKEIAAMLTEHADLKLLIEGHTDNVGADAANLALSEKRAAAVKAALVAQFGADGARLTTKGFGASKPAAPNTSTEGRQTNRRVELVKQ